MLNRAYRFNTGMDKGRRKEGDGASLKDDRECIESVYGECVTHSLKFANKKFLWGKKNVTRQVSENENRM